MPRQGMDRPGDDVIHAPRDRGIYDMAPGSPFDQYGIGDPGGRMGMPEQGIDMGPGAGAKEPPGVTPGGRYGSGAVASGSVGGYIRSMFAGLGGTGGGPGSTTDELLSTIGRDREGGIQTAQDASAFFGMLGKFNIPIISKAAEATAAVADGVEAELHRQEAEDAEASHDDSGTSGSDDSGTDSSGTDDSSETSDSTDEGNGNGESDTNGESDGNGEEDASDNGEGESEVSPGDPDGLGGYDEEGPSDPFGIVDDPESSAPSDDGRVGGDEDTEGPSDPFGIVDDPEAVVPSDDGRVGGRRTGQGPDVQLEFQDHLGDPPREDMDF